MPTVNQALRHIFAEHGVPLVEEGEWLTTNGGYPACCGTVTDPIEGNSGCRVRLDIELALDEHQTIVESFGDVGETPEEAVRNSLFNFCQSSLHVVLSDCWQVHDEEQVLREVWTINNRSWQMTIGNFIRKAEHGADIPIPNEIFTTIEKAIQLRTFPEAVHWLRLYYGNLSSHDRITEALLNNESWDECVTAIEQLKWPALELFYSCRLFLMMRPLPRSSKRRGKERRLNQPDS